MTSIKLSDLSDFEDWGTFRTYSGRGMYGKYCLGFECDGINDLVQMVMAVCDTVVESEYESGLEEFHSCLSNVSSDSMGMGMIFYWRGVQVDDE